MKHFELSSTMTMTYKVRDVDWIANKTEILRLIRLTIKIMFMTEANMDKFEEFKTNLS
jgi:hypothetical protein